MFPERIRIKKNVIFLIMLLFPFIQQRTYSEMPAIIGMTYRYWSILSSLIIVFLVLRKYKVIKKEKSVRWIILLWSIYILSTLINCPNNFGYVFYHALAMIAIVLLIVYESKKNLLDLMQALSIIYGVFIYANVILAILKPNGLYVTGSYHSAYLLGDDNAMVYVVLPGIICMMCYSLLKHKMIRPYVWVAAILSEILFIYLWSVSAFLVLGMFMFLVEYTQRIGKVNPKFLMIFTFVGIALVLFGNSSIMQGFIVNVLHKDITLSNRSFFWAKALQMIAEKPILGYGGYFLNGRWKVSEYSLITYPCHTPYLQILIDGGILAFIVFIVITMKGYFRVKNYQKSMIANTLAIGMTCMLINYITEYSEPYHYFIILSLMLIISKFDMYNRIYLKKRGQHYERSKGFVRKQ